MRPRDLRKHSSICVLTLAVAAAVLAASPTLSSAKKPAAAGAKLSRVDVSGTRVTVSGQVTLPENTAKERRRTRVGLALSGSTGAVERHTVTITAHRTFSASWRTKLTGSLVLSVRVTIGGRPTGKAVTHTVEIHAAPVTPPTTPSNALIGTFSIQAGDTSGATPDGSYFEMLQPDGSPLANLSAEGGNPNFTPFTPGTDGGFRTYAYQGPPSPAFSNGMYGNALGAAIIKPVEFYGWNFTVVTAPTDPQLGTADPLPVITAQGGSLSGQISDWTAQWNGSSFNQGTPKPDGSLPSPTTALSGSYDPTTGAYSLQWQSRIVGGPFNGFAGVWHLSGTFVPESESPL